MNTPPWLQPIMDITYPTGPNQLWVRKENNEPQPIMSTQKENTKPQPIMGTQDFGFQPIMGTMRPFFFLKKEGTM